MDIRAYWQSVGRVSDSLPDCAVYYLTSEQTSTGAVAGVVIEVSDRKKAAQLIVDRTHRLATVPEVEKHLVDQDTAARVLAETEMKRKQQFALPPEISDLVKVSLENLRQQDQPKKEKK